ncbi:MAG: adenine phosphoribosyltransferase [Nitrospinota bacterium]
MLTVKDLTRYIRNIPDFPTKGVLFKDITTLLSDAKAFHTAIDILGNRYIGKHIDLVVGVEARGFIIGAALAYKLNAGVILMRKPGKLPYKTHSTIYELEYGKDTLEVHQDSINHGQNVLIADDLLATGGTTAAAIQLVEKMGGHIVELAFLIELSFLKARERLKKYPIFSLIQFDE